jgi:flagellar biosynthesis protein FliQ
MNEDNDKNAFRLDTQAKSFQLTGFRWRQTPGLLLGLVLTIALLTAVNFVADRSLSFLDRETKLLVSGTLMGFGAGVWVGRCLTKVLSSIDCTSTSSKTNPQPDKVKSTA